MTNNNLSSTAAFLWSVADLLRSDFKLSRYGRIILPFTLQNGLEIDVLKARKTVLISSAVQGNIDVRVKGVTDEVQG